MESAKFSVAPVNVPRAPCILHFDVINLSAHFINGKTKLIMQRGNDSQHLKAGQVGIGSNRLCNPNSLFVLLGFKGYLQLKKIRKCPNKEKEEMVGNAHQSTRSQNLKRKY